MKRAVSTIAGLLVVSVMLVSPAMATAAVGASSDASVQDELSLSHERGDYPGGMTEEEYYSLSLDRQEDLKLSAVSRDDAAAAAKLLAPTATQFMDQVRSVGNEIDSVFAEYVDVHTRYEVDTEVELFKIKYFEDADSARIDEYLGHIGRILSSTGFEYIIEPANYLLSKNVEVVNAISSENGNFGEMLKGAQISALPDLEGDGVVRVAVFGVDIDPKLISTVVDGVAVSIVQSDVPVVEPQTRFNDFSPWSAGALLSHSTANNLQCTEGFSWTRWSDSKVMGSTAAHCYTMSLISNFYNNGMLLGSRSTVDTSKDAMLLSPAAGKTFARSVFVSVPPSINTNIVFPLIGASVLPVGSAIAFSGAATGSHVSSVAALGGTSTFYNPNNVRYTVSPLTMTWSKVTQFGDSGGPWITSNGSSQAFAHGTHFGLAYIPGLSQYGGYAGFMDANSVSAALQATIYTY